MKMIKACFSGDIENFSLNAQFETPVMGVTALFGPSGCGKTSILRCIAGLHQIESGFLQIGEAIWQNKNTFLPVFKRPIGYVFQEASLFPHLNVKKNLTYGMNRSNSNLKTTSLDTTIQLLGLEKLLDRAPNTLSGGERQRVAIGRALLSSPELLLMDEPLSALDQFSKDDIIPYLEKLRDELEIPILYVSHDIHEIERIADNMILLEEGKVKANGPLSEILVNTELPLLNRTDAATVFEGIIENFDDIDNLTTIAVRGGKFLIPGNAGKNGSKRRLRIFANDVSLSPAEPSQTTILNVLKAKIINISRIGNAQINILCQLGDTGEIIPARISRKSQKVFNFQKGNDVFIQVKGVSLINA